MYWLSVCFGALFLGWVDTHTDEIPILLGLVLIASAVVGSMFPGRYLFTWLVMGLAVFGAETLVHFRLLHAPYPVSAGLPWPGLVALVPGAMGVGIGTAAGRLLRERSVLAGE